MRKGRSPQRQKRQLSLEEWRGAAFDELLIVYAVVLVGTPVALFAIALFWLFQAPRASIRFRQPFTLNRARLASLLSVASHSFRWITRRAIELAVVTPARRTTLSDGV